MSENEVDIDELPHIEVDSLGLHTSNISDGLKAECFVMPAADELACERERELVCERELRALPPPPVSRSDSSGSEGEALAAAVQALRVLPLAPHHDALSAHALLEALVPHVPHAPYAPPDTFLHDYLDACRQLHDNILADITDHMLSHVSALVSCEDNVWSSAEVVSVGVWLCVVSVGVGVGGTRAARALRVLLQRAAPAHAAALARVLGRAPPPALLPLADVMHLAAHHTLAADLCDAALAHHLGLQKEEVSWSSWSEMGAAVSRRWGSLAGDARYSLVQLVGRRLSRDARARDARTRDARARDARARDAGDTHGADAVLRALERPPAAHLRHHPDHLKVSVGVSKLQLLFGAKN